MHNNAHLALSVAQVWALVIGTFVPLLGYVVNKYLKPTEPVAAVVHVVLAAAGAALYTALDTSVIGFNVPTLQLVLTAVVAALGAHHWLWKPSLVSEKLRS